MTVTLKSQVFTEDIIPSLKLPILAPTFHNPKEARPSHSKTAENAGVPMESRELLSLQEIPIKTNNFKLATVPTTKIVKTL